MVVIIFARSAGLRNPQAVTRTRVRAPINLQTFDRKPAAIKHLVTLVQTVWGR